MVKLLELTLYVVGLTSKMWRKCEVNKLSTYCLKCPFWQGLCCIQDLVKIIIFNKFHNFGFWRYITLKGFNTVIILLCLCLTHARHRILDVFFAKHTNWSNETIRILKTHLNLSSSLLQIDFSIFLNFWF